eukprot:SAG11_NODE_23901_length_381_cov_1.216312_1_plen_49_part_10
MCVFANAAAAARAGRSARRLPPPIAQIPGYEMAWEDKAYQYPENPAAPL